MTARLPNHAADRIEVYRNRYRPQALIGWRIGSRNVPERTNLAFRGDGVNHRYNSRGLTLLELVVVIAIAAILLSMAAPALGTFVENAQLSQASGDLASSLNYARNKAINLDVPVGLCPVAGPALTGGPEGATCVSGFQPGAGTSASWMVYRTQPGSSTVVPLAVYSAPSGYGLQLYASGFSSLKTLLFGPTGLASASGQILVCDQRGNADGVAVAVSADGMISVSPARGQDASGLPLSGCPAGVP